MTPQAVRTIADLMTGDLVAIDPSEQVARARTILAESGLHALPIIERDQAVGVVTLADCVGTSGNSPVSEVITGPPVTIDVEASVAEAAELMRYEYIHHLLVTETVGGSDTVVGILSSYDLLAMLIE